MKLTRRNMIAISSGAAVAAGFGAMPAFASLADDAIAEITGGLFADGNPTPSVASFKFGALSASRSASTRIRLAGTQNVVAIAQMEDGSFQKAQSNIKVTIGGCGG